jgi:rhodanese-related sulfurtransferase
MRTSSVLPRLAALVLAVGAAAVGCSRGAHSASVKDMTVQQLADLQKAGSVVVLDANTEDFRKENGVIPGAVLLTSSSKYDVAQLPADKSSKLVFYCTSRL